jgi:hypothetical protein
MAKKKQLVAQLELESRFIPDIVTKATGYDDATCRAKLLNAVKTKRPDRHTFWLDYYTRKGQLKTMPEDGWVFLTDCTDTQLDPTPVMIELIKEQANI